MKPPGYSATSDRAGFTMIEIALSLAIIGFALVAIIGVMPTGMRVQKENREETVINQDGLFLLDAIRSGAKGLDDLTNFVESITIRSGVSADGLGGATTVFTNSVGPASNRITNSMEIVGLLSRPKLEVMTDRTLRQNQVTLRMRAINGVASDKSKRNDELAFRYLVTVEIVPFSKGPSLVGLGTLADRAVATELLNNLYDVRLTFRWPLFPKNQGWETGRGRKTFRTLVSGELTRVPALRPGEALYYFDPTGFTSLTNRLATKL